MNQPGIPDRYLGKSDKYVVTISSWQDTPSDFKGVIDLDAIADSFMFITYLTYLVALIFCVKKKDHFFVSKAAKLKLALVKK